MKTYKQVPPGLPPKKTESRVSSLSPFLLNSPFPEENKVFKTNVSKYRNEFLFFFQVSSILAFGVRVTSIDLKIRFIRTIRLNQNTRFTQNTTVYSEHYGLIRILGLLSTLRLNQNTRFTI